ncbi:MAG: hypothetical protein NT003_05200 [Candidatus Magasanikbacteria bacterium]|nr:hypothetical protein [Candidatus Magasanikbacteria bacterium]
MRYIKPLLTSSGFILLCVVIFVGLQIQFPQRVSRVVGIESGENGRPPIIGIYSAPTATTSTLTLFRTTDGLAQVFPGLWRVNFISPYKAAVFGETLEQKNLQKLYVLDGVFGKQFSIASLPGEITHVSSNSIGTYLLVTGLRSNKNEFYSCVADTTAVGFPCEDVAQNILGKTTSTEAHIIAFWNPEKARELVIIDQTSHKNFTYDPWDGKPKEVDATYVATAAEKMVVDQGEFHFKKIGILLRVENVLSHDKKTYIMWPWSEIAQIASNALMIKTRGRYEILNVTNNTYGIFTTQDPQTRMAGFFKSL